jgi:hypothetical protein
MKKPYCCDDSRKMFERYYDRHQKGEGEFPIYADRYAQEGHGLGSIIGSLFRRLLPVLNSFAPHALRAGANVLHARRVAGQVVQRIGYKEMPEGLPSFSFGEKSGSGKRKKHSALKDIFG